MQAPDRSRPAAPARALARAGRAPPRLPQAVPRLLPAQRSRPAPPAAWGPAARFGRGSWAAGPAAAASRHVGRRPAPAEGGRALAGAQAAVRRWGAPHQASVVRTEGERAPASAQAAPTPTATPGRAESPPAAWEARRKRSLIFSAFPSMAAYYTAAPGRWRLGEMPAGQTGGRTESPDPTWRVGMPPGPQCANWGHAV